MEKTIEIMRELQVPEKYIKNFEDTQTERFGGAFRKEFKSDEDRRFLAEKYLRVAEKDARIEAAESNGNYFVLPLWKLGIADGDLAVYQTKIGKYEIKDERMHKALKSFATDLLQSFLDDDESLVAQKVGSE